MTLAAAENLKVSYISAASNADHGDDLERAPKKRKLNVHRWLLKKEISDQLPHVSPDEAQEIQRIVDVVETTEEAPGLQGLPKNAYRAERIEGDYPNGISDVAVAAMVREGVGADAAGVCVAPSTTSELR